MTYSCYSVGLLFADPGCARWPNLNQNRCVQCGSLCDGLDCFVSVAMTWKLLAGDGMCTEVTLWQPGCCVMRWHVQTSIVGFALAWIWSISAAWHLDCCHLWWCTAVTLWLCSFRIQRPKLSQNRPLQFGNVWERDGSCMGIIVSTISWQANYLQVADSVNATSRIATFAWVEKLKILMSWFPKCLVLIIPPHSTLSVWCLTPAGGFFPEIAGLGETSFWGRMRTAFGWLGWVWRSDVWLLNRPKGV